MIRRCLFLLGLVALLCLPAAGLLAQTPLGLELVAAGLSRPVLVTAPPGDLERIFIVEQTGRVRIVRNGSLLPTPFLDFGGSGLLDSGGEKGLLGLAFHRDYANTGIFCVYRVAPGLIATVDRFQVSGSNPDVADFSSRTTLLTQQMIYGNHNAGTVAFGLDGFLYVSLGDGGSTGPAWIHDEFNSGQDGQTFRAKILRIDVDNPQAPNPYGIPASNPFVGSSQFRPEIWSYGLRNPYRCSFDRLTGDFYIADVGGAYEEIDFEPAGSLGGRNYGWACMTGNTCNNQPVCTCFDPALSPALYDYNLPGPQAIIGGYVYRGCAIPDLRGSYFFADYVTNQVWSLQHNGTNVTQLVDRTAELVPPSPYVLTGPSGFGEDGYGELYLCNLTGEVYRIVPTAPQLTGVQPFGVGTVGCNGPHTLSALCSPVVGNPAFALRSNNAPPQSVGLLAFSDGLDISGSDPLGVGLLVHVQVTTGLFVLQSMTSDVAGVGSYDLAIPPMPSLSGMQLHAQAIWGWSLAVCSPSTIGWSSSPGLTFVLQP
jgi:glucose/arabinose dehydrogenase